MGKIIKKYQRCLFLLIILTLLFLNYLNGGDSRKSFLAFQNADSEFCDELVQEYFFVENFEQHKKANFIYFLNLFLAVILFFKNLTFLASFYPLAEKIKTLILRC